MSTTEIQKLGAALESALQILEDEAECRLHSFSKGEWETDAESIASMDLTDRLYCLPVLSAIEKARAALGLAPYQAPVA